MRKNIKQGLAFAVIGMIFSILTSCAGVLITFENAYLPQHTQVTVGESYMKLTQLGDDYYTDTSFDTIKKLLDNTGKTVSGIRVLNESVNRSVDAQHIIVVAIGIAMTALGILSFSFFGSVRSFFIRMSPEYKDKNALTAIES